MSGLAGISSVGSMASAAQTASIRARMMNSASETEIPTLLNPTSASPMSTIQLADGTTSSIAKSTATTDDGTEKVRQAFQDFVAGTFYKQMLKALRSGQGKPAYLHGGQAEEMFQSQLDQQVAEDLARHHGGSMADSLYESFQRQLTGSRLSVEA